MYKKLAFILMPLFIFGILDYAYGKAGPKRDLRYRRIEKMIDKASVANIKAENRQIRDNHYTRIVRVHSDYEKIAHNSNFPMYISSLPSTICNRAKDIILNGTSSEIIKLLYGYKNYDIPGILEKPRDTTPKQTPAKFLKKSETMPLTGMQNFMDVSQQLTAKNLGTDVKQDNHVKGMINKNGIIAIVNESERLQEEIERHKELHFRKIAKVHPNYEKIAFSANFNNYINSLPEEQMKIAEIVFESGSAEEIIALLSSYKKRPQK